MREKIRMKTGDNYNQASIYRLFGCPKKGITKQALKRKLMEWGINASTKDLDALFLELKFGERKGGKRTLNSDDRYITIFCSL